jgi:hypothetical protein
MYSHLRLLIGPDYLVQRSLIGQWETLQTSTFRRTTGIVISASRLQVFVGIDVDLARLAPVEAGRDSRAAEPSTPRAASCVMQILHNPLYAGVYAFGRRAQRTRIDDQGDQAAQKQNNGMLELRPER